MKHLVIGAGQIGPHVAQQLAASGVDVTVATRSGRSLDALPTMQLDAGDPDALARALEGVTTLHLCVHASAYRVSAWRRELPGLEATVLAAAETTGTTVVFPESVYAFDTASPVSGASPLAPRSALGRVRQELLDQRSASSARTVSVIAGDFIGPGATQSHAGPRMWEPAVAGRTVRPVGAVDVTHAWTALPDLAAAMIAAAAHPDLGDRLTAPAIHATQREVVEAFAATSGATPRIAPVSPRLLRAVGAVSANVRSLASTGYLFTAPLHIDDAVARDRLGLPGSTLTEVADAVVRRADGQSRAAHA